MIEILINSAIILLMPFIFIGIINKVKSFWQGRRGQPFLQSFYDMAKLLKKGQVISNVSGNIFGIFPALFLASTLVASMLMPMINTKSIFSFNGDFVVFAYFLALGKFFAVLSAMDTGSSFSGMGASREASYSALLEPAFFIILASVASISGFFSFNGILFNIRYEGWISLLLKMLCVVSFFIIMLTESSRVPVDDPNTHLELTMIHEVMVLDNSGPGLGIIGYASGIKMVVLSAVIVNLLMPLTNGLVPNIILFLSLLLSVPVITGFVESFTARLRFVHIPQFILLVTSVAMIVLAVIQFAFSGAF